MNRKDFLFQSAAMVVPGLALAGKSYPLSADPAASSAQRPFFNVADHGARGDGKTKDTTAIQAAIDAAGETGGTVCFPPGKYLSGTIRFKSHVTLFLGAGSTLMGSPDNGDYDPYEKLDYNSYSDHETTYFHYALVRGEDVHHIAIVGEGIIDGNRTKRGGPKPIALKRCREIAIRGITLQNAPNYNISLLGCDYVDIDGVTIFNGYADGIDPDCCRYVRIANCFIESADDAIVPKASPSLGEIRPTEKLTVTNCVLTTPANGLKFGTESSGDFKDVAFSNCVIFSRRDKWKRGPRGGLAIESVDGAHIERVVATNITMHDVEAPIFIRLGNRGRGQRVPTPGMLRDVSISNIVATHATLTSSITGLPGRNVEGISIHDIRISAVGGGSSPAPGYEVPEVPAKYPESNMFGELPAYALYCRHAESLSLEGLHFQFESPDARPALVTDDVKDLDLLSLRAEPCSGDQPVVLMHDVNGALLQGARALSGTNLFLQLSGSGTQEVHVLGNDLSAAQRPFEVQNGAQKEALAALNNLLPNAKP